MRVYNYSEARQNFSSLLNTALNEEVIIARKDGSKFKVVPIGDNESKSPFDIKGINANIGTDEILDIIRESRQYD
jgi:antitoxin (DNA-binding transcriptional repressor) of toxin-antitoxin stability system